jgi:hypothetical protein
VSPRYCNKGPVERRLADRRLAEGEGFGLDCLSPINDFQNCRTAESVKTLEPAGEVRFRYSARVQISPLFAIAMNRSSVTTLTSLAFVKCFSNSPLV